MRNVLTVVLCLAALTLLCGLQAAPISVPPPAIRFQPVHVFVETGDVPLAAYQLDFRDAAGVSRIVGIEGGDGPFAEPPYYDPAAMQQERVIIADFSTLDADALPSGRVRVATIHVEITGDRPADFTAELTVAATIDGKPIEPRVVLHTGALTS